MTRLLLIHCRLYNSTSSRLAVCSLEPATSRLPASRALRPIYDDCLTLFRFMFSYVAVWSPIKRRESIRRQDKNGRQTIVQKHSAVLRTRGHFLHLPRIIIYALKNIKMRVAPWYAVRYKMTPFSYRTSDVRVRIARL